MKNTMSANFIPAIDARVLNVIGSSVGTGKTKFYGVELEKIKASIRARAAFIKFLRDNHRDSYACLMTMQYGHVLTNYEKDVLLGLSREFKARRNK